MNSALQPAIRRAQTALLDALPSARQYLLDVVSGDIPEDPIRTKIALSLLDHTLTNEALVEIKSLLAHRRRVRRALEDRP